MLAPRKPPSIKQLLNEKALKIYAVCLLAIIFTFVIHHWLCKFTARSRFQQSPYIRLLSATSRQLRGHANRAGPRGFPTVGHGILFCIYLLVNVFFCFNITDTSKINFLASRFGWMATANTALCVFLSLKNTPLAFLLSTSHNRLNSLHKIVGYTIAFLTVLHALFYTVYFGKQGRWDELIKAGGNVQGLFAAASMLLLFVGVFGNVEYEIFYVSHIVGFMATIVLLDLHRPDWTKNMPKVMAIIGVVWMADRIIRGAKFLLNGINNNAAVQILPEGGVRLVLKKPLAGAVPGTHCAVWIPRIRLYQTHPFTILTNGPSGMELVMKKYDGFTKDLYDFARTNPKQMVWAAVDGPYGSVPDMTKYDKIVFVAGGTGVTFTLGLLKHFLDHLEPHASPNIEFIWATKSIEHLSWFAEEIYRLQRNPSIRLKLHVTGQQEFAPSTILLESSLVTIRECQEQNVASSEMSPLLCQASQIGNLGNLLNNIPNVRFSKLDIEAAIEQVLVSQKSHQKILVATCGPKTLMREVRETVAKWMGAVSSDIDIICEDFE